MKNCDECKNLMSQYIDGELIDDRLVSFERHLTDCSDCKQELAGLRSLIFEIGNLPEVPLPGGFHHRWMEAVKAEASPKKIAVMSTYKGFKFDYKALVPSAACMLICFVLLSSGVSLLRGPLVSSLAVAGTTKPVHESAIERSLPELVEGIDTAQTGDQTGTPPSQASMEKSDSRAFNRTVYVESGTQQLVVEEADKQAPPVAQAPMASAATGEVASAATGEVASAATGEVASAATGEVVSAATGEVASAATGEAVSAATGEAQVAEPARAAGEVPEATGLAQAPEAIVSDKIDQPESESPQLYFRTKPLNENAFNGNNELIVKAYYIELLVEDVGQTINLIKALPISVDSSSITKAYGGLTPNGQVDDRSSLTSTHASLILNGSVEDYDFIIDELNRIGNENIVIAQINESSEDLTDFYKNTKIKYDEDRNQIGRLLTLIQICETAENIIAVERRIDQLESVSGERRYAYTNAMTQAKNPTIVVNIRTKPPAAQDSEVAFGTQVSRAFTGSINFSATVFETSVVTAAYLILPILIVALIAFILLLFYKRVVLRGRHK